MAGTAVGRLQGAGRYVVQRRFCAEIDGRRYARDAYAASVLCHSREELRVVFARMTRRDAQDNPLQPSRLLFACSDADLVRRARRYFGERRPPTAPRPLLLARCEPI